MCKNPVPCDVCFLPSVFRPPVVGLRWCIRIFKYPLIICEDLISNELQADLCVGVPDVGT